METEMEMETVSERSRIFEDYIKSKYEYNESMIRVYINEEEEKYFIDTFAGVELGLIDYNTACSYVDSGRKLFEISKEILEVIKKVFEGRIEYILLQSKYEKNDVNEYHNSIIGDLLNSEYEEYKNNKDLGDINFENYLSNKGYLNDINPENNDEFKM